MPTSGPHIQKELTPEIFSKKGFTVINSFFFNVKLSQPGSDMVATYRNLHL